MAQIKAILIAHGEKILLGLVAIFSLYSILGNLLGETKQVGDVTIDPTAIHRDMDTIREHTRSDKAQTEAPEMEDVRKRVLAVRNVGKAPVWMTTGWDGLAYGRLPEPPTVITPVPPKQKGALQIPEDDYFPIIDAPVNVRVRVGGKRVVVTWEAGPQSQWIENVRAIIWRKAVGEAREGAKSSALEADSDDLEDQPRREEPTGGIFGGGAVEEQEEVMEAPEEFGRPKDIEELIEAEMAALSSAEDAWELKLKNVLNANSLIKGRWKMLKAGIEGVSEEPDAELLLAGDPFTPEEDDRDGEEYEPEHFYFVDDTIEENTVYRYRVILYATPKDLPAEFKEDERFKWYWPFLRMKEQRLALNKKAVSEYVNAQKKEKSLGARATQMSFAPLVSDKGVRGEEEEEAASYYWLPKGMKERLVRKSLEGVEGYSPFTWSPYILTPVRTSIRFISKVGNTMAMFKVRVIDDQGDSHENTFQVKKPVFTPPKGPIKSAADYYSKAGFPKKVKPAIIGGTKKVRNRDHETVDFDFSTRWGLVDIRECDIEVKRYTLAKKRSKSGKVILDRSEQPVMVRKYKDPVKLPSSYCVLMELKKGGRLKRLLRHRKNPKEEVTIIDRRPAK
ncbi:MAG: hypothetical protein ACYTGH_04675 [Planctomycetota bacterium]|jgi:hypothetical protein